MTPPQAATGSASTGAAIPAEDWSYYIGRAGDALARAANAADARVVGIHLDFAHRYLLRLAESVEERMKRFDIESIGDPVGKSASSR